MTHDCGLSAADKAWVDDFVKHHSVDKDFALAGSSGVAMVPFDLAGPAKPRRRKRKRDKAMAANGVRAEPIAAGLAVRAEDTGRVLVLQRALNDDDEFGDPAAGKLEFAGGHIEGDETPFAAACREWSEEVGSPCPAGKVVNMWTSADGVYVGYVMVVPHEADVKINLDYPRVANPDAPLHAKPESAMWMSVDDLIGNPAVRAELALSAPWPELRTPWPTNGLHSDAPLDPGLDPLNKADIVYHGVSAKFAAKATPGMLVVEDQPVAAITSLTALSSEPAVAAITGLDKSASGMVTIPAGTTLRVTGVTGRIVHLVKYSDDQPRDDRGRFGSGDGGGAGPKVESGAVHIDLPALSSQVRAGAKVELPPQALQPFLDRLASQGPPPVNLEQVHISGAGNENLFDAHHPAELPREAMPVIPSDHAQAQAFADMLSREGVGAHFEQVDPRTLTATQNQLDGVKVGGMLGALRAGTMEPSTVVVAQDGHHRWAAYAAYAVENPGFKIEVMRVGEPIEALLKHGEAFDAAQGIEHQPFGGGSGGKKAKGKKADDRPPCPDESKPYIWADGAWHLLATDTADGVPRTLEFSPHTKD